MKRTAGILTSVLLAITTVGCGGTSDSSQVASTVKAFLTALANGNGTKACDQLTASQAQTVVQLLAQQGVTNCAAAVSRAASSLNASDKQKLLNAKVVNVHVSGNSATADIQGGTQPATLSKAGGRWYISAGISP